MKSGYKHISGSLMVVGLLAATTASADPFNAGTQLTPSERGAWCLIESFMSATAAAIQANGCVPTQGTMIISTDTTGAGAGQVGSILLTNAPINNPALGTWCPVTQVGPGQLDLFQVSDYATTPHHAFSQFGDVFIDTATLNILQNSGAVAPFDEHSIKNFNVGVSSLEAVLPSVPLVIFDDGLEVITKNGYPLTKWTQFSAYARDFVPYTFPVLGPVGGDAFFTVKYRGGAGGFPNAGINCSIAVFGTFADTGGVGANVEATLVTAPRPLP